MTGHHDDDRDEDKVLAEVFSRVGPRLLPPEATRNAVHRAAHAAWLQAVARRRRRRLNFALAAGISFLVFGTAVLLNRQLFTPPVSVSAAAVPPGDATLEEAGDGGRRLVAASGELLRLRPQSQIAMKGGELWLLRGAVYVESAEDRPYGGRQNRYCHERRCGQLNRSSDSEGRGAGPGRIFHAALGPDPQRFHKCGTSIEWVLFAG